MQADWDQMSGVVCITVRNSTTHRQTLADLALLVAIVVGSSGVTGHVTICLLSSQVYVCFIRWIKIVSPEPEGCRVYVEGQNDKNK